MRTNEEGRDKGKHQIGHPMITSARKANFHKWRNYENCTEACKNEKGKPNIQQKIEEKEICEEIMEKNGDLQKVN